VETPHDRDRAEEKSNQRAIRAHVVQSIVVHVVRLVCVAICGSQPLGDGSVC
jgi:hypothetical protein